MKFEIKHFSTLSKDELYDVLALRSKVFVVEQDCVYLDPDGLDKEAYHVLGRVSKSIEAYTRILKPGSAYPEYVSVGRVLTSAKIRKSGLGVALMKYTIEQCQLLFPATKIKISAQSYLIKFYNDLGFYKVGEEYLEDGIPHIGMVLT